MPRVCAITGRTTKAGNNRPFSMKATKRKFKANMFWRNIFNPLTGKVEKLLLSAKGIKTLKKITREKFPKMLEKTEKEQQKVNESGTGKHVHKEKKLTPKQKKEQEAAKEKDLIEEVSSEKTAE